MVFLAAGKSKEGLGLLKLESLVFWAIEVGRCQVSGVRVLKFCPET